MKQRLEVARALAVNPDMLFLDEPFGALDSITRLIMRGELLRIWEAERKTIIFVTHDIDEAVQLADRVVVLHNGIAVANDTPAALKASIAAPRVEVTTASGRPLAARATTATVADLRELLADAPADATVAIHAPTLDDVFLELTKEVSA